MDNERLPYEINRTHLHHLHLALNPNRGAKGGRALQLLAASLLAWAMLWMKIK
jgi:hypothetical protein